MVMAWLQHQGKVSEAALALGGGALGLAAPLILWFMSALRLRLLLFGLTARLIRSVTVIDAGGLLDVTSMLDRVTATGDDFAGGFDVGAL